MTEYNFTPITKRMKDIAGHVFGRLTAIGPVGRNSCGATNWLCSCECGTKHITTYGNLNSGHSNSCGCLRVDRSIECSTTHNETRTPEHGVWAAMKRRCYNLNDHSFKNYGGRGISVCERWHDFSKFIKDMGKRPTPNHTIDRTNNNLGYFPENCRWATWTEQQNNRRNNRYLTLHEDTLTVAQWSRKIGISQSTIHSRIRYGWPTERVLLEPVKHC